MASTCNNITSTNEYFFFRTDEIKIKKLSTLSIADKYQFQFIDLLGVGSYSRVFRAKNLKTNEEIALKVSQLSPLLFQANRHESRIATKICQINEGGAAYLLKIKDFFSVKFKEGIAHIQVFDVMKTSISKSIYPSRLSPQVPFPLNVLQKTLKSIFLAVEMMHRHNFVHADLKPSNILLDEESEVKVADFGSTIELCDNFLATDFNIQTLWYRAPEVLLMNNFGKAIDMWSIGCIAAEMYQGKPLFCGKNEEDMIFLIMNTLGHAPLTMTNNTIFPSVMQNDQFKSTIGVTSWALLIKKLINERSSKTALNEGEATAFFLLTDLIQKLLKINPEERITAEKALDHFFLKKDLNALDKPS